MGLLFLGLMTFAEGGCATVPRTPVERFLVALRYDVEPVLTEHGHDRGMETVRRDFAAAAELGFNCVLLRHLDDRDVLPLLDSAAELGLGVALTPRACTYYVRTGRHTGGGRDGSPAPVARALPDVIAAHPAFAALVVDAGGSDDAEKRGRKLVEAIKRRGVPCVLWRPYQGTGGLNTIRVPGTEGDAGRSSMERILAQFHAGLAAGLTSGFVVDGGHALPGEPPGVFDSGVPISSANSAALRAVMTRAVRWGRRLFGAAAESMGSASPEGSGELTLALLTQAERRYALIVNSSAETFFRGDVAVPHILGGVTFRRAVEVPPSAVHLAGRVVDARDGRLPLSIELRPGDAALFELF